MRVTSWIAAALLGVFIAATPAGAASYTVTTLSDAVANDGQCSLREAIQEANNGADTDCAGLPSNADDTIAFSVSGSIVLGSTLPNIVSGQGTVTVDGGGNITISGNNAVRVMIVDSGAHLTLQNLTIANGNSAGDGGGISNSGTLTVTNSTFSANSAGQLGGGIYNGGTLNVTNSTFSGNSGGMFGGGGGIYNDGTLIVTNSIFSGNSAGSAGGIYNGGTLTVTSSIFSANSAPYGGGISNWDTLTVTNCTFSGNTASSGGGSIDNRGTLNVTDSTFSGNSAGWGGGINNHGGTLTVTNSTFSGNSAADGGGIHVGSSVTPTTLSNTIIANCTFSSNSAGYGGGIENSGTLSVSNTTFSNNSAASGGGMINWNTLTVTNSTFSGNSAYDGGGISNWDTLTVTNCTFSGNSASNTGGAIHVGSSATATTLSNTLIANSASGGDCVGSLTGINTNNLIEDSANACGLVNGVNGNIIGVDPNLGPLTGSPAYFPLIFPSAAIDAGDPATCSNAPVNSQSQNGLTRPQDGDGDASPVCDIGSFEAPALVADMEASSVAFPPQVGPGQTVTSWSFLCSNLGPDPAINATCSIAALTGSVSNVSCSPAVPVDSLAAGATINCAFDFTAPGTAGGSNTPETGGTVTVNSGAANDSDLGNNTIVITTPLVDALNDAASFPANTSQTYNVGSNDQYGTGSLPGTATFSLQAGATCASASINSTTGVTTLNVPASGTCVVAYQVCVGTACDTAQLTVTALVADMGAALGSLAPSMAPAGSYTSLSFSCTNNGPDAASNATCSIAASAGTVSSVSCTPSVPVPSLASGASISCTYTFTAPGAPGGSNTPETGVTFTVTTGADNDSNPANNTASNASPVPLVDALDEAASFPANSSQTYNVGANDQYGAGSLPGTATFSLQTGTTCALASINSTTGIATFNVPASGSCVVAYQVCVGSTCDTAQLTVTAQQQEPIPTLDEWAFFALLVLVLGTGLVTLRRAVV